MTSHRWMLQPGAIKVVIDKVDESRLDWNMEEFKEWYVLVSSNQTE